MKNDYEVRITIRKKHPSNGEYAFIDVELDDNLIEMSRDFNPAYLLNEYGVLKSCLNAQSEAKWGKT